MVTLNKEKKTVSYLCEDCYYKRQQQATISIMSGICSGMNHPISETPRENVCRNCGTTARDFLATGILGCENCYNDLAPEILAMIQSSQVKTSHTGKSPIEKEKRSTPPAESEMIKSADTQPQVSEENAVLKLKKQLENAILTENFEQACVLRDKINRLESERAENA